MKDKFLKRKRSTRVVQVRHTHKTAAGLEDALAVALDIIEETTRSRLFVESRTQKLLSILRETRAGPHAYNPERPAGVRITIRKR